MFVEIENVFRMHKTVINLNLVTEINEEKHYVRTTDGKKYDDLGSTTIERLLLILKARNKLRRIKEDD